MDTVAYPHIVIPADGKPRIGRIWLKVRMVAEVYLDGANSIAAVQQAYANASLAEIHSALTYYYDHRQEMDENIAELKQVEEEGRKQFENSALQQRLLAARKAMGR